MKLLRSLVPSVTVASIVVLQISCGGDASGPARAPASIAANSSTTLTAAPGAQVTELPSVLVRDANGDVLAGAAVAFTVTGGGGTVTGGNATTNSAGIATVGSWTLGATAGENTLDATTGNLPAVTFTAAGASPCSASATHTLGSTTNAELTVSDCKLFDGTFVDFYNISIPTAGTYIFNQSSTAFDTYLLFYSSETGQLIGVNDDAIRDVDTNSRLKMLLPAGNFVIGANAYYLNAIGAYTLSSSASTDQVTNCEDAFVVRGISSPQSLQSTDCTLNGSYGDEYLIVLTAGLPVTVSMTSSELDSYLEIHAEGDLTILANNNDVDSSTKDARVVFTPTVTNFYVITARSTSAGVTGAYTLSIQ
jgi:hypothetical protein